MNTIKACLFGGALLTAGISAQVAAAQSFTNEGSSGGAYAYNYNSYALDGAYSYGSVTDPALSGSASIAGGDTGSWAWDSAAGTWSASFTQGQNADAYGAAYVFSAFSVADNYTLTVSWDLDNINRFGGWELLESDDLSFNPLAETIDGVSFDGRFGTPSESLGLDGQVTIQLDASKFYLLRFDLSFADTGGTPSDGSLSASLGPVPAPGAVGVLGLAGLAAARRRRA
jgi:hypothetical protein